MNIGNAALAEILWTSFALVGLAVSLTNVYEAIRDLNVIRARPKPDPLGVVYLRSVALMDTLRAGGLFVMVVIGILAMIVPPRPPEQVEQNAAIAIIQGGIVFVGMTLAVNALVQFVTRRRLKRLSGRGY